MCVRVFFLCEASFPDAGAVCHRGHFAVVGWTGFSVPVVVQARKTTVFPESSVLFIFMFVQVFRSFGILAHALSFCFGGGHACGEVVGVCNLCSDFLRVWNFRVVFRIVWVCFRVCCGLFAVNGSIVVGVVVCGYVFVSFNCMVSSAICFDNFLLS